MSWKRHLIFLALGAAALAAQAQNPTAAINAHSAPGNTNLIPPFPKQQSPVAYFRQLLAMTPAERNNSLTNRPPEARKRILEKVHEYTKLDPDERELRLKATELRWWLTPLLQITPASREPRLAQVPDDLREIVRSRLSQWDALPTGLQKELLANDKAIRYFANVQTNNPAAPTSEQKRIAGQFDRFFELTPAEKQQTLNTLSAAEREAMEKTLKSFEQLPPQQRVQCIRNYAKFAGMNAAERKEFLKNAEKWSKMSPKERESWRDLVARVPIMPPVPTPPVPSSIYPHVPPKRSHANVATN